MSMLPFRGKCWHCGHDHSKDQEAFKLLLEASPPTDTITITKAEYDALVADKERLDWLQNNFYSCEMDDFDKKTHQNRWAWRFYGLENVQSDVRRVIDSAIKANHD